ncbi:MAG: ABC transporter permease [Flavobacteriales bacterium]|nr:ABC transporter permease [Flavobacteriales bacterium]
MKKYFAFVKKEFRHIFRDKKTLLILFGMPVAQILIFGFALNNEVSDAGVVVYDMSGDYESEQLRTTINASNYFHEVAQVHSIQEIEASFKAGNAKLAVIIPRELGNDLRNGRKSTLKVIADASDPNEAQMLVAYMTAVTMKGTRGKVDAKMELPLVTAEPRMIFNPELKSVYMFVPGVMGFILLLVSAMMTSLTIAKEKEFGTMELLLVSPLRSTHIIFGKVTPYWILSFINAMIIIILGITVFDMPLNGSVTLLIAICLLFSLTALALGIFISSRSNSQMTAMFISMLGLLLPTILLSGFIFPIENMPIVLRGVSHIIPARWFIIIIKGIMIQGAGLSILLKPFGILGLITLFFSVAAIRGVKPRLDA